MLVPGIDKTQGLANKRRLFFRHVRNSGQDMGGLALTKAAFATMHEQVWDGMEAEDVRGTLTGDARLNASDDFILFLLAACAEVQATFDTITG